MFELKDVKDHPRKWVGSASMNLPDFWNICSRYRDPKHPVSMYTFTSLCWEETFFCNIEQGACPIALGPGQLQVSEYDKVFFFAGINRAAFEGIDGAAPRIVPRENYLGERWDSSRTTYAVRRDLSLVQRSKSLFAEFPEVKLDPLTKGRILKDNEFAIKMHWRYFDWIRNGNGETSDMSESALLDAQTGGNKAANDAFITGGIEIERALNRGAGLNELWQMNEHDRVAYAQKRREDVSAAIQSGGVHYKGDSVRAGVSFFPTFWKFMLPDEMFLPDPFWGY